MVVGLITDQYLVVIGIGLLFAGQETAFLNGAERVAKMMNFPVFYCELTKTRRGYCEAEFKLMTEAPKETVEGEITQICCPQTEQTIRREYIALVCGRISAEIYRKVEQKNRKNLLRER